MLNPFEKALMKGKERSEVLAIAVLLLVFVLGVIVLDVAMAMKLPSTDK